MPNFHPRPNNPEFVQIYLAVCNLVARYPVSSSTDVTSHVGFRSCFNRFRSERDERTRIFSPLKISFNRGKMHDLSFRGDAGRSKRKFISNLPNKMTRRGKFEFYAYYPPFPHCRDEFASWSGYGYGQSLKSRAAKWWSRSRGGYPISGNIHIIEIGGGRGMDGCRFSVNNSNNSVFDTPSPSRCVFAGSKRTKTRKREWKNELIAFPFNS